MDLPTVHFSTVHSLETISSTLEGLIISANYSGDELVLKEYPNLLSIHFSGYHTWKTNRVSITSCPRLQFIISELGSLCCIPDEGVIGGAVISNCPQLVMISLGVSSFESFQSFELSGKLQFLVTKTRPSLTCLLDH